MGVRKVSKSSPQNTLAKSSGGSQGSRVGQRGTTNSRKVALEGNGIGGAEKGRGGQAWTVVKIRARGQAGRRRVNMKDRMPWFPGQGEQPVGGGGGPAFEGLRRDEHRRDSGRRGGT